MRSSPLQIALFSLFLFAAGLALFTRSNRFPFYRHPDEPVKVEQLRTGDWNFNHPMLLLSTARLALAATGTDLNDPQRIVETGRWVSAGFAAGTAALMAAALWIAVGRFAGIAVGLLVLTNHQLFELSHYLKEDAALVFGISAWLLGVALYGRKPGRGTAALVGAGAALALSGKYVGVFAPVISLWLLARPTGSAAARWPRFAAFAVALVGMFALINAPLLCDRTTFESSFSREVGLVVNGQRGMTRSVPHVVYFDSFRDHLNLALLIFVLLAVYKGWQRRKELTPAEALVLVLPMVYMAAISFSPKTHDRYFLPATVLFSGAIALGMNTLKWKKALPALLAVAVALQIGGYRKHDLLSYYKAFQTDDRADLTEWLNERHPGDVVVQDRRTLLPTEAHPAFLPWQPKLSTRVLPLALEKYPDLQTLRAQGVTLAALCQDDFGRYNQKSDRPQKGAEEAYQRMGQMYWSLRHQRKPLWERPRGLVIYLHPGLAVYTMPE